MSKWKIAIGDGEWFLSEVADWCGGETFMTEPEALEELRRVQLRAVLSAESDLKIAKRRLTENQRRLADPPRVSYLK